MSTHICLTGAGANGRPFNPLDYSPALWLDMSDISTLFQDAAGSTPVAADNDAIARRVDKSGNARHWTTSTSGFRPLYKTSIQNTRPGCLWDGTNDALNFATGLAAASMVNSTLYVVARPTGGGGNDFIFSMTTAMSGGAYAFRYNALKPEIVKANLAVIATATNAVSNTTGSLTCVQYDGTNYSFRTNRTANGSGTSANSFTAATTTLGAQDGDSGQCFSGYDHEILVFYSQHSAATRTLFENYLANKWGTP